VPSVSIGDALIHYEEQGSGPPLLLVPGLSGLGSFWAPQLADFARDFRVLTHDYSDELASRIPGAKLLVLGTGGHLAPTIVPGEYNAAVGGFLREHRTL